MALSLACSCGAGFEVAETLAGQVVRCPECQRSVQVPAREARPLRTSGYAVASVVLALVGAFTVFLTAAAVVLGLLALVSIARNRRQVAGSGYALFGIVAGLAFTALTLVALSRGELFGAGGVREWFLAGQLDYSGPLEIQRAADGFAITRPSEHWGVSRGRLAEDLADGGSLMLANLTRDAYVEVTVTEGRQHRSLDQCRDDFLAGFRDAHHEGGFGARKPGLRLSGFRLRESRRLPRAGGADSAEVLFDVRLAGQALTYLTHIIKREREDRVYVVSGWVQRRHFVQMEPELRRTLESFRLLGR
jgi:hypothetical protein